MPLPMVHLSVAVLVAPDLRAPWAPAWLLGNLAPDAIHMREGTGRDDKRDTHLHPYPELTQPAIEAVIMEGLELGAGASDPLLLGYAAHLYTDALWRGRVWLPARELLPVGTSEEEQHRIYYAETDEIDRQIYESADWRPEVWRLLAMAPAADVPGLVSAEEIDRWRVRTLRWFESVMPATEPQRYLTHEIIQAFSVQAAAQIADWFQRAGIWPADAGGRSCARLR